jgi:hypothetical protein
LDQQTRRPTTKDVARRAGVSQGTVSNVLNHPEWVSGPKRKAVEEAIAELGFVRHEAARHLRTGYSQTIGMLLLDTDNPGFIHIARGVEDYAIERGWTVLIANSPRDLQRERAYLRVYAEARVAGVIVVPHDEFDEGLHDIGSGGMPAVVIDRPRDGAGQHLGRGRRSTRGLAGGTTPRTTRAPPHRVRRRRIDRHTGPRSDGRTARGNHRIDARMHVALLEF